MNKTKGLLFTAGIVLAMAFTFSCSLDDVGGGSSSSGDGGGSSSSGDTPSSSSGESSSSDGTGFTDPRDGTRYKAVVIGTQTWLAENLNYNAPGSKCYNDSLANCETYGRLYDWETAMDVCPAGWHLPSNDEWQKLVDIAGGDKAAGAKLKASSGWNESGNGTDEFGFNALPGGGRSSYGDLDFEDVGNAGLWWSASEDEDNSDFAYARYMSYDKERVYWDPGSKSTLISVRCVQGEGQDFHYNLNNMDEMITAIVKALQTRNAATLNRLVHPDYGVAILTGNALQFPHFRDRISFLDDLEGIGWTLGTFESMPNITYRVRREELPTFDYIESTWDKPTGIYCQTGNDASVWRGSLSGLIEMLEEYEYEGLPPDAKKKAQKFDGNRDSYTILAIDHEDWKVIRFTITLIDGRLYLTLINMYYPG